MRTQLLKLLQRLPAAGFAQQSNQASRAFVSYSGADERLFSTLSTRPERANEQDGAFGSFSLAGAFRELNTSASTHVPGALSTADNREANKPAAQDVKVRELSTFAAANMLTRSKLAPPPKGWKPYGSHAAAAGNLPTNQHPFHLVDPSCWPFVVSFAAGGLAASTVGWMHGYANAGIPATVGLVSTVACAVAWWRECNKEANMGYHTDMVRRGLQMGMWMFIASEAALFFAFLWSCVHVGMAPNVWLQLRWPPVGVEAVGWDKRALMMSIILASSYLTANIAQYAADVGNIKLTRQALAATVGLGAVFVADQVLEYSQTPFTFHDSAYGSTFFLTTGFHGMHVILGSLFLATAMFARKVKNASGLRAAILYWHFVDIVWIGVYGIIYVGGY